MKKIVFLLTAICCMFSVSYAQEVKYQLSSHILDISSGKPAPNVKVTLSKKNGNTDNWTVVEEKVTDKNGRIGDFLKLGTADNKGIYKLTFYTNPYFKAGGHNSFYPFITVVFELTDNEHYHVPITISPYGYATYRGS